jgi:hypothetical protein
MSVASGNVADGVSFCDATNHTKSKSTTSIAVMQMGRLIRTDWLCCPAKFSLVNSANAASELSSDAMALTPKW